MSGEIARRLERRQQQAVNELIDMVKQRYPTASFEVGPGPENPEATHIIVTVDVDDPDEVTDLVLERELELQIDEGIPVYVIPIHTPERVAELLRQQKRQSILPPSLPA